MAALGHCCSMWDLRFSLQHARSLLKHVGSTSLTRGWTRPSCIGNEESLSHWTTREVPRHVYSYALWLCGFPGLSYVVLAWCLSCGHLKAHLSWVPKLACGWQLTRVTFSCGLGCSRQAGWVPEGHVPKMSIPRDGKWKLLGLVRAVPRIGTASLPPYSFVQSIHRAYADSVGWIDSLHLLMGKWPGHIADKHVGWEIPLCLSFKIHKLDPDTKITDPQTFWDRGRWIDRQSQHRW